MWGKAINIKQAKPGDLVVYKRTGPGTKPTSGHIEFFIKHNEDGKSFDSVGGNQSDKVSIKRGVPYNKSGRLTLLGGLVGQLYLNKIIW